MAKQKTDTAAPTKPADDQQTPKVLDEVIGGPDEGGKPDGAPTERMQLLPEVNGRNQQAAIDLLLDCCDRYGVNPSTTCRPKELASWKFYPGDDLEDIPDSVVIVTHGGLKIRHFADPDHPMDPETEERLRLLFRAWGVNDKKERVPVPLPSDLTLPESAVTGQVVTGTHRYQRGYLREGGKGEADRRAGSRRAGK